MVEQKIFNKIKENAECVKYIDSDMIISTQKRQQFDINSGKKVASGKRYVLIQTTFSKIVIQPEEIKNLITILEKAKTQIENKMELQTIVEIPLSIVFVISNQSIIVRYTNDLKTYAISFNFEKITTLVLTLKDLEKELSKMK